MVGCGVVQCGRGRKIVYHSVFVCRFVSYERNCSCRIIHRRLPFSVSDKMEQVLEECVYTHTIIMTMDSVSRSKGGG